MNSAELADFRLTMADLPMPSVESPEPKPYLAGGDDDTTTFVHPTSLEHVFRYVSCTPWAIKPEVLAVITDLLTYRLAGHRLEAWEVEERIGHPINAAGRARGASRSGAVALLSLYGVIAPRASMVENVSGPSGTGLDAFSASLDAAVNDDEVSSIVIDVNSPGGTVDMVPETGDRIRAARDVKPIYAVANVDAGSAAYWLASQASELVVTQSGAVGSIGVYMAHQDLSAKYEAAGVKTTMISAGKYKLEGNPFEALSDEARDQFQSVADDYYGMFVDAVAKGRDVRASVVRGGFGEGRMLTAKKALAEGMVDRIDTLEGTIRRALRGAAPTRRPTNAASFAGIEDEPDVVAVDEPDAGPSEPDATIPLESVQYLHS